ncbi:MAG: adenylate kinase [Chloroflexia bacterium]|nr:adenylate kinase [Chloroflexia bacterium]
MEQSIGKRIIVVGSSNAGKSTLAEELAGRLGVPFIELDALHWEPGWVAAEREVFRERVREAIEPESWVMAGNYTSLQQDVSWPAADTIVWLDLNMPTVLRRCIVRCWQRSRSADLLWGTNRENFWEHLMFWDPEKSLPTYILKTHGIRRRTLEALTREPRWSHITFIRLRSVEDINRWLDGVVATADQQQEVSAPPHADGSRIVARYGTVSPRTRPEEYTTLREEFEIGVAEDNTKRA